MSLKTGPKDQAERLRELVESENGQRKSRVLGGVYNHKVAAPEESESEGPKARVIAITSGKGGVGKTNLAVNLGISLAQSGKRVALLDADLGLANIDIVLGLVPQYTLVNVIRGERSLPEITVAGPGGLEILAGGSGVYELANVSPWHLDRFIKSFQEFDKLYDIFLIDTGAGIGRHVLSFLKAAQETIIVTTPEPTAVTDAYGLIKMLCLGNPEAKVKVVVNMVDSTEEAGQVFARLDAACTKFLGVKVELLGHIIKDPFVGKAVKEQVPFMVSRPGSKAGKCVAEIAAKITDSEAVLSETGGLRAMFKKVIGMVGA